MKKLKFLSYILLAALTLTSAKVWADEAQTQQDPSSADQQTSISLSDFEALKDRISALERGTPANLKVSGWLQLWYTHDSYAINTPAGTDDYNSSKNQWDAFSIKRSEIVFSGSIGAEPKLAYKLSLDPAQPSFTGQGLTTGTAFTNAGNINPFTLVKDVYTQITYAPYFGVVLGQNKLWNELEGRTPSKDLDFNNYSNVGGNSFGNKRDLGVHVVGSQIAAGPAQLEYDLAVIQGSGQSTADNNADKDLAARVGATYDNLFLGTSTYSGTEPNGVRQYLGFEGRWVSGGFKAQAEFVTGSVNTLDNSTVNDSSWTPSLGLTPKGYATPVGQIMPTGYYLQANYRLGDWRLGARWDGYNFNQQAGISSAAGNQEWDTYTIGLDWFQVKDAYKLSLNWEDHLLNGVDEYNVWTVQSQIAI